ncbi:MAG TPA: hypothetical protein VM889_14480 [Candidatus Thermoplasmatota archaeon]|nr:hypothetical protein [Candidatus Thermoplasmatota archaeon]
MRHTHLVVATVALTAALALAGCVDLGEAQGASAGGAKAPGVGASDPATSFKHACYLLGGHTARLPAAYVTSNDTRHATGADADGKRTVCYTDRQHLGLDQKTENTTWSSVVLRIDADGRATYLDASNEFAVAEPHEYETRIDEAREDRGSVRVDASVTTLTQGDVWRLDGVTVAKNARTFEVRNLVFTLPPGYDTTP